LSTRPTLANLVAAHIDALRTMNHEQVSAWANEHHLLPRGGKWDNTGTARYHRFIAAMEAAGLNYGHTVMAPLAVTRMLHGIDGYNGLTVPTNEECNAFETGAESVRASITTPELQEKWDALPSFDEFRKWRDTAEENLRKCDNFVNRVWDIHLDTPIGKRTPMPWETHRFDD
jgi:hypothetical protein